MDTSAVEANKQVVRNQMAALERGDAQAQGALMSDDVRWWLPQSAAESTRIPRPLEGKEAVLAVVGNPEAFFTDIHNTVHHMIAEGDYVALRNAGAHHER
jgi:ketosteroid isomerase-like protein